MLRRFGSYLLAHDRNAIVAAFLCALLSLFGFPIGFGAMVIVGLLTLRKGWKAGLVVLVWVALPTISLLVLQRFGLFDTLLPRCILVWALALLLRKTNAFHSVLEVSALLGVVAVLLAHAFFPDILQWWHQVLTVVAQNAETSRAAEIMRLSPDQVHEMMQRFAPFATGLTAAFIVADLFTQLALARWWENSMYYPGKMREEFSHIHMSYLSGVIFLLASVGLYWQWPWLVDVYPVLVLPFAVAGLSLLHQWAVCKKGRVALLVLVYVLLFVFTIPVALLLALMGLLDSGYDFRKRCLALQSK